MSEDRGGLPQRHGEAGEMLRRVSCLPPTIVQRAPRPGMDKVMQGVSGGHDKEPRLWPPSWTLSIVQTRGREEETEPLPETLL